MRAAHIADSLLKQDGLDRTTIYFTHYLFEAYRLIGTMDAFFDRMSLWLNLKTLGCKTMLENADPAVATATPGPHTPCIIIWRRSSASGPPRRALPRSASVRSWDLCDGPAGPCLTHSVRSAAEFTCRDGHLEGQVNLPEGLAGELEYGGQTVMLSGKNQAIRL